LLCRLPDLNALPSLTFLGLSKWRDLTLEVFLSATEKCTRLHRFNLNNNYTNGAAIVLHLLKTNPNITEMRCRACFGDGRTPCKEIATKWKHLETLDISNSRMPEAEILYIITECSNMKRLLINCTVVIKKDLIDMMKLHCEGYLEIQMRNCLFGDELAISLIDYFKTRNKKINIEW